MRLLIATDLDRTALPNGEQPESPEARPLLRKLAARPEVTLVYISGRNRDLQQEAIKEYDMPLPDYAVGDVGTTIYTVEQEQTWDSLDAWSEEIAPAWAGKEWADIKALFDAVPDIRVQDDSPAFQNRFKVSYYTDTALNQHELIDTMKKIAKAAGIKAAFIWSIDEQRQVGLLDVLPEGADKLHALQFLRKRLKFSETETVFSGDSGNDLPAFTSGLQAIAVKNTHPDVLKEAQSILKKKGLVDRLYVAQGGFLGLNGNYSAGIIEGVAHYVPAIKKWLE